MSINPSKQCVLRTTALRSRFVALHSSSHTHQFCLRRTLPTFSHGAGHSAWAPRIFCECMMPRAPNRGVYRITTSMKRDAPSSVHPHEMRRSHALCPNPCLHIGSRLAEAKMVWLLLRVHLVQERNTQNCPPASRRCMRRPQTLFFFSIPAFPCFRTSALV